MRLKRQEEISVERLTNQKKAYNIIGITLIVISLMIVIFSLAGFSMQNQYKWRELFTPGLILLAGIYTIFRARKIKKVIEDKTTE